MYITRITLLDVMKNVFLYGISAFFLVVVLKSKLLKVDNIRKKINRKYTSDKNSQACPDKK
jgi:hypothetical protein